MAGLILQAQGKHEEARHRFEAIVGKNPRAAFASNNLAYMYASRGEQLDRALQLAQAAKAERPEDAEASDTLALVYIKKQLGPLAIPLLRLAIEKRASEPVFHYHLGLAYAQTGDKGAARRALEHALQLKADFEGAEDARTVHANTRVTSAHRYTAGLLTGSRLPGRVGENSEPGTAVKSNRG